MLGVVLIVMLLELQVTDNQDMDVLFQSFDADKSGTIDFKARSGIDFPPSNNNNSLWSVTAARAGVYCWRRENHKGHSAGEARAPVRGASVCVYAP